MKEHDFSLGNPLTAPPLPGLAAVRFDAAANQLVLEERGGGAKTQVLLSRPGEIDGSRVRFPLELAPRELWELRVDVVPSLSGDESQPHVVERRFGEEREHVRDVARGVASERAAAADARATTCARRSPSRWPTSPRCGCGAATGSGSCPRPACRGS